jgi:hypothetical protein
MLLNCDRKGNEGGREEMVPPNSSMGFAVEQTPAGVAGIYLGGHRKTGH